MRLGTLLALGGLAASVFLVLAANSWLRGRSAGSEAAEADIAHGTPWIREMLGRRVHLTSDGWGIDRETGLPLEDTALMCSTGVDLVARSAENAAYNATIRAAFAAGKLERFGLNHKVRTAHEIRLLFADSSPTRLAEDGDRLCTRNGIYDVTDWKLNYDDADLHILGIKAHGGEAREHQLFYPSDYAGSPRLKPARGPLAAIVADDQTTLIVRDAAGYMWVIDLPRAVIIQVVAPIP